MVNVDGSGGVLCLWREMVSTDGLAIDISLSSFGQIWHASTVGCTSDETIGLLQGVPSPTVLSFTNYNQFLNL